MTMNNNRHRLLAFCLGFCLLQHTAPIGAQAPTPEATPTQDPAAAPEM